MSRQFLKSVFLSLMVAAFLQSALAQTSTNSTAPSKPTKPCSMSEHRQFDFWLGDWDVTVGGKPAGTNSIQLILGDCVLLENWTGAKGGTGKSFNLFNAARGKWQQTWVDNSGNVLELYGEFKNGAMQLTGETFSNGKKAIQRITWHPLEKDKVRQHWEQSQDDGKTWSTAFDGLYARKK
ncbi:MAG: hypothetical protein SF097_13800 [Acidobacteriota bacterium]|nr:hypothetical protein [Acidobacteriota bacterium]